MRHRDGHFKAITVFITPVTCYDNHSILCVGTHFDTPVTNAGEKLHMRFSLHGREAHLRLT